MKKGAAVLIAFILVFSVFVFPMFANTEYDQQTNTEYEAVFTDSDQATNIGDTDLRATVLDIRKNDQALNLQIEDTSTGEEVDRWIENGDGTTVQLNDSFSRWDTFEVTHEYNDSRDEHTVGFDVSSTEGLMDEHGSEVLPIMFIFLVLLILTKSL